MSLPPLAWILFVICVHMIITRSIVSPVGSRWYPLMGNVSHNVPHLLLVMRVYALTVLPSAHHVLICMIPLVWSVEMPTYCWIVAHANRIVKLDSSMRVSVYLAMSVPTLKDVDYAQSPNSVTSVCPTMMDNPSAKDNSFCHQPLSPMDWFHL